VLSAGSDKNKPAIAKYTKRLIRTAYPTED
jgi:hypothetical protein